VREDPAAPQALAHTRRAIRTREATGGRAGAGAGAATGAGVGAAVGVEPPVPSWEGAPSAGEASAAAAVAATAARRPALADALVPPRGAAPFPRWRRMRSPYVLAAYGVS
jgi:hypothetical protein